MPGVMLQCNIVDLLSNTMQLMQTGIFTSFNPGRGACCTGVVSNLVGGRMSNSSEQGSAVQLVDLTLGYERHPAVHHINCLYQNGRNACRRRAEWRG